MATREEIQNRKLFLENRNRAMMMPMINELYQEIEDDRILKSHGFRTGRSIKKIQADIKYFKEEYKKLKNNVNRMAPSKVIELTSDMFDVPEEVEIITD